MLGIRHYKGIAIDLWQGDITKFYCDAIVNAANSELLGGGGVDGAIHTAGGPTILEQCKKIGGCKTGESVYTAAGDLPCQYVIHTVGPVWQGGSSEEPSLLFSSYLSSLKLANQLQCRHITFSAISCGVYGYPHNKAAEVAMAAIRQYIDDYHQNSAVRRITLALFNGDLHDIFQDALFLNYPESE